jgi:aspartate kinase
MSFVHVFPLCPRSTIWGALEAEKGNAMSKMKIGGIMQTTGLAKVGVMSIPDRPGIAGSIMAAMGRKKINIQFIVQCIDIHENDQVVFCISQDDLEEVGDILQEVKQQVGAEQVIQRPNVAIISIFGPDFRERPGIAGTMFSALGEREINILAISTSISTLTCVIDADRLPDAVAAMREAFDLP